MKESLRLQKNVSLKDHTTFKIGGPAEYFLIVKKTEDLVLGIKFARENKLKITIFGGGSNLLVSDKGLKGLVIKIENKSIRAEKNLVFAGAGTKLESLVNFCLKNNFNGFEWSAGIPKITVGGAVYGNAQAFGVKISDFINNIEALDLRNLKIKNFSKKQCQFGLKKSIFKKNKNLVIISAVFSLKKGNKKEIQKKIKEYINYRKSRHPLNFPSAGSVFVNPEIIIKNKKLLEKFPELNEFNKRGTIHVGYLIEKSDLKGKKIGGAQISEKHSNFIVNKGGAKAKDVLKLMALARGRVKKIFGIELETEVQLMGPI
jgi:UDP-N-acetylmuramate dehydrogenase